MWGVSFLFFQHPARWTFFSGSKLVNTSSTDNRKTNCIFKNNLFGNAFFLRQDIEFVSNSCNITFFIITSPIHHSLYVLVCSTFLAYRVKMYISHVLMQPWIDGRAFKNVENVCQNILGISVKYIALKVTNIS